MSKVKGSAYLFAIGAVSILVVIALLFGTSKTARRWSTRLMGDESRAEALANAAVEITLRKVKDAMNDEEQKFWYLYFRNPARVKEGVVTNNCLGVSGGANAELDLTGGQWEPVNSQQNPDAFADVFTQLDSIIKEMGGPSHVDLVITSRILNAGAITSSKPDYPVVGISVRSKPAGGEEAEVYDSINKTPQGSKTLGGLVSDYIADFALPNQANTDSHSFKVKVPIIGNITGTVTLNKTDICKGDWKVEVKGVTKSGNFDFNEIFRKYVKIPEGANISFKEIMKLMLITPFVEGTSWRVSSWMGLAKTRYAAQIVQDIVMTVQSYDFYASQAPVVMEKMGLFQIQAKVKFRPNGTNGKEIIKTLNADREFKVSDVQPPAPEYSLFIANSTMLAENAEERRALSIQDPIIWWQTGLGTFTVHNLPQVESPSDPALSRGYDAVSGFAAAGGDKPQLPGMIRINSMNKMAMNVFLGTVDEPTSTEFNQLYNEKYVSSTEMDKVGIGTFSFQWTDRSPDRPIDFPLVRNTSVHPAPIIGIKNLKQLLAFCDALSGPTLMFGLGAFEYPLPLRIEAYLNKKYSRVNIKVMPKGKYPSSNPDRTEIDVDYQVKELPHGLPAFPAHSNSPDWSPNDQRNMPANLYSTLQYAKKANYFYENEAAFWGDAEKFIDMEYNCDGVTYIKGDLNIKESNLKKAGIKSGKLTVKGRGLLVVKDRILVESNILRKNDKTVFGLIARRGDIDIKFGCNRIEAACYSNLSPKNEFGNNVVIDGNLVANEFLRDYVDSIQIQYNSHACRISPLSVIRDVGKFEPQRYLVSLGKRWAQFEYQKL